MDSHSNVNRRKWGQFKLRTLCLLVLFSGPIVYFAPQFYDRIFPAEPELPSAYWGDKSIQYFPAGPEFRLTREAQALKDARAEAANSIDDDSGSQRDGD